MTLNDRVVRNGPPVTDTPQQLSPPSRAAVLEWLRDAVASAARNAPPRNVARMADALIVGANAVHDGNGPSASAQPVIPWWRYHMPKPEAPPMDTDPEYKLQGGWKVHIAISPENYDSKVGRIAGWIQNNFKGSWKHLHGGEKGEKDFTVYLGSWKTMQAFVERFEGSDLIELVIPCPSSDDRLVGTSKKLGTRFDTKGTQGVKGHFPLYGLDGIPIAQEYEDFWGPWNKPEVRTQALELSRKLLAKRYGSYFTGE